MANLVARNAREGEVEGRGRVGPVTIAFESVRGELHGFFLRVVFVGYSTECGADCKIVC